MCDGFDLTLILSSAPLSEMNAYIATHVLSRLLALWRSFVLLPRRWADGNFRAVPVTVAVRARLGTEEVNFRVVLSLTNDHAQFALKLANEVAGGVASEYAWIERVIEFLRQ